MQVDDAVEGVVRVLESHPLPDRPEVVPEVERVGRRLDAGEHPWTVACRRSGRHGPIVYEPGASDSGDSSSSPLASTVTRTRATRRPSILVTFNRTLSTSTASPPRGSLPRRDMTHPATVS